MFKLFIFLFPLLCNASGFDAKKFYENKCIVCHSGESEFLAANLNELQFSYISKQLNSFKNGSRVDYGTGGLMNNMAKSLSEEESYYLAKYLSKLDRCENYSSLDNGGSFDKGKSKFLEIQCGQCHDGFLPTGPSLFGQKTSYISHSLKLFRSGKRYDSHMNIYAKELSDEDIDNISFYLNQERCQ